MMTFGSLFSGIGGIDLGLERAGMSCKWQVEIDPFCRQVLAKHWPDVTRYSDVREVKGEHLEPVDLVAGGFPCQDISNAGKCAGINGERSGLWHEFFRIICALRPHFILVENVSALRCRGLGRVLGDLAAIGYDAEWSCVSACAMGAPHTRDRLFIVSYPNSINGEDRLAVYSNDKRPIQRACERERSGIWAHAPRPSIRVADGVPNRLDRLRGLGNAVVPQIAEWIGRQIMENFQAERRQSDDAIVSVGQSCGVGQLWNPA